jgi:ribosomal protein S20
VEPSEPLYPFTLALSYLEKCDSEIANWRRVRETRELDNTQYDAVLSTYASHRRQAEAFVEELREEAREALAREEPQLDELVGELRRISRAATKGVIKPTKANRISRRIQKRLAPLQERIHLHQTIAEVRSSAALGGPIELPLDDFAPRLRKWVALPPPDAKKRNGRFEGAAGTQPQASVDIRGHGGGGCALLRVPGGSIAPAGLRDSSGGGPRAGYLREPKRGHGVFLRAVAGRACGHAWPLATRSELRGSLVLYGKRAKARGECCRFPTARGSQQGTALLEPGPLPGRGEHVEGIRPRHRKATYTRG